MKADIQRPVDWERFRTLATDANGLAELIEFYLSYTQEQLDALEEALTAGDVANVELLAHRLAGSNATAGTTAIVAPLVHLEEMAHHGTLTEAAGRLSEARDAFTRIRAFFSAQIPDELLHD